MGTVNSVTYHCEADYVIDHAGKVRLYIYVPGNGVSAYEIVDASVTSIDGIAADDFEGAVEYFNLYGVKVNADNLTPGIYVKKQGDKAQKVLVK